MAKRNTGTPDANNQRRGTKVVDVIRQYAPARIEQELLTHVFALVLTNERAADVEEISKIGCELVVADTNQLSAKVHTSTDRRAA